MIVAYLNKFVEYPQVNEDMLQDNKEWLLDIVDEQTFKMKQKKEWLYRGRSIQTVDYMNFYEKFEPLEIPEKFKVKEADAFTTLPIDYCFVREKNTRVQVMEHVKDRDLFFKCVGNINKNQLIDNVENQMLESLSGGDIIITSTLLNFSRYFEQGMKVIRFFHQRGIHVIAIAEKFNSYEPISLMESDSYFKFQETRTTELSNARKNRNAERVQKHGKGPYTLDQFPFFAKFYDEWQNHEITKTEFAKKLVVSRPALDKLLKEYKEGN